jgi:hypothetical protein
MDPYMLYVLERQAQEMRDRAAPHTRHVNELLAARAAARRLRRHKAVHALLAMLRGHGSDARVPASVGGRT